MKKTIMGKNERHLKLERTRTIQNGKDEKH
jgi:hypothetical protein